MKKRGYIIPINLTKDASVTKFDNKVQLRGSNFDMQFCIVTFWVPVSIWSVEDGCEP